MSYDDDIYHLLQRSTVRITTERPSNAGTGVAVAPGLLLTCAHVVCGRDGQAASSIQVYMEGRYEPATIEKVTSQAYPDLALLAVTNLTIPCVLLGEDPAPNTPLYSFGFPASGAEIRGEPSTSILEGFRETYADAARSSRADIEGDGSNAAPEARRETPSGQEIYRFLKFKEGQVLRGSSGAPLLNELDGTVCGIIKRTRNESSALGGIGIPTSAVFAAFPELHALQQEYHRKTPQWKSTCRKVRNKLQRKSFAAVCFRATYSGLLLALIFYWVSMIWPAYDLTKAIFEGSGALGDQNIYRALTFNAEESLLKRVKSLSIPRYDDLENFIEVLRFREIPVRIVPPTPYYIKGKVPENRYILYFDAKQWRFKPDLARDGPRIALSSARASYSERYFSEQNKCLEDYRRATGEGRRELIRIAPPFASLGYLVPQSSCKLFLEPNRTEMNIAELLARASAIDKWRWTYFLLPRQMSYIARRDDDVIMSTLNDYLYPTEFGPDIFDSLSVEQESCEKFQHCTTQEKSAELTYGNSTLRESLPSAGTSVRRDYLEDNKLLLNVTVTTLPPLKSLQLLFFFNPSEEVRMDSPFHPLFLIRMAPFKDVLVRISRTDGGMSFLDFAIHAWQETARFINLPGLGTKIDSYYLALILALVALADAARLVSKRYPLRAR